MSSFPITGLLNPFGGLRNLIHLGVTAVISRMMISVVRLVQNEPSRNHDPKLSENQKRQALIERVFVELLGTSAYILILHMTQDIAARLLERGIKIPTVTTDWGVSAEDASKANKALKEIYGANSDNLIFKTIYGPMRDNTGQVRPPALKEAKSLRQFVKSLKANLQYHFREMETVKANLANLKKAMGEELLETLRKYKRPGETKPVLDALSGMAKSRSSIALLIGVFTSAIVGGLGVQWLNDNKVTHLGKWFVEKFWSSNSPGSAPAKPSVPATPGSAVPTALSRKPLLTAVPTQFASRYAGYHGPSIGGRP